jgi:hypothetical protein
MESLTPEQLGQLQKTAELMFNEAMTRARELPAALRQARNACDEAVKVLRRRADGTSEPELRGLLEGAGGSLEELLRRVEESTRTFLEMPTAATDAHDAGVNVATTIIATGPIDPAVALSDGKASLKFDKMLKQFGVGMIGLIVMEAVDDYTETTEGFLGHKAGSVRIGQRLKAIAEAGVKDAVGLAAPPFFDTFREVVKQVSTSQVQKDIAALVAETGDRLFRLRRLEDQLKSQMDYGEQYVASSKEMAVEAATNEARALTIAKAAQAAT